MLGRGLLIIGPSGSGKSALALRLLALGADLVADDQTLLRAHGETLLASAPPTLAGLIEARHVGLLRSPHVSDVPVVLVADLGTPETDRLPAFRSVTFCGLTRDLVRGSRSDHFADAMACYLRHGRQA